MSQTEQSTAVDEHHTATRRVAKILVWASEELTQSAKKLERDYRRVLEGLDLPADDEANALARLREVLGISE